MNLTRPVTYRRMTADQVLAELRLFCRYELAFTDRDVERLVRPNVTLADLTKGVDDLGWDGLLSHFHLTLPHEWWAQWKPELHTVGDLCADLAARAKVPGIEPATILGTPCETAGAFLTLKQMLADEGADVRDLRPSSEVLPYLRAKPNVFDRFRLSATGRLMPFDSIPPLSCLVGVLLVFVGGALTWYVAAGWVVLFALGVGITTFGLARPDYANGLRRRGIATFRDLIHAALGRTPRTRTA